MTLINQSGFAAMHSVSRKSVTGWKARGWLAMVDGLVDVDASNALLIKHRPGGIESVTAAAPGNAASNKPAPAPSNDGELVEQAARRALQSIDPAATIDAARLMKETYLGLLNQLEYDKESGLVVEAAEVAKAVGEEYAKVRTRLLSIPSEQAPRIHRLKTVTEVQDALQELITEALEELTKDGVR